MHTTQITMSMTAAVLVALLACTGSAGPAGSAGPVGPTGPQGTPGPQGVPGPTGPDGMNGATGATGATGPQGIAGMDGMDGMPGAQGPAGMNGLDGAPGPQGPAGPTGATGATGATGPGFDTDGGIAINGPLRIGNPLQTHVIEAEAAKLNNGGMGTNGSVLTDPGASNGGGVALVNANVTWTVSGLTPGAYVMTARLKSNANGGAANPHVTLSVSDGANTLGLREVYGHELVPANIWRAYSVPFTVINNNSVNVVVSNTNANTATFTTSVDYMVIAPDTDATVRPCRAGFWPVADGRICMKKGALEAAATIHNAIGTCRALGGRVCMHNDMQQACGGGLEPYAGVAAGWYSDHVDDNIYMTWNAAGCSNDNDGPPAIYTTSLPYRCCY